MSIGIGRSSGFFSLVCMVAFLLGWSALASAQGRILVGHDVPTHATKGAGSDEGRFAVDVATDLTKARATRNLLLFGSTADFERNLSAVVRDAMTTVGFTMTLTSDSSPPFSTFDAVFAGVSAPRCGGGHFITKLGSYPDAEILQQKDGRVV